MVEGTCPIHRNQRIAAQTRLACWLLLLVLLLGCRPGAKAEEKDLGSVGESARNLPVAYDVDVVVVGGSTGAVSAAVAAAKKGAKVFLTAPRPYLGEDMCATLRLWLEPGERLTSPLARALFTPEVPPIDGLDPLLMADLRYETDIRSAPRHPDADSPTLLADQKWGSASAESVEYDGDVNIVADLGKERVLTKAGVLVYHGSDYRVDSVTVAASLNKRSWKEIATIKNERPPQESIHQDAIPLLTAASGKARYLRFSIKRAPGSKRVLVGEVVAFADRPDLSAPGAAAPLFATPLEVKKALDAALLEAKADFLYSCGATDVLRDAEGNPCGIVMANRAGRQAVLAKVIVDATDRAWVARMAGAEFQPFPAGVQEVKRVVIGGEPRSGPSMTSRAVGPPMVAKVKVGDKKKWQIVTRSYPVTEYTLRLPMPDGSYASWARAEQLARDMTYHPDQQFTSEVLFQVPPDPMIGRKSGAGEWKGIEALDIESFQPANVSRLFVLGGCADVPRDQAERLLRPPALVEMGVRVGEAAASMAQGVAAPKVAAAAAGEGTPAAGDVKEILEGVRPGLQYKMVPISAHSLPVLGQYDVVVIGGGTSGAPAGIAAARQGARTLLVEYLHGLGGVGTLGAISVYCSGNRVGFTKEVCGGATRWEIEQKMEWLRSAFRKAGGDLWFGALGCGAFVQDGQVKGAVVVTPQGRGVVLAKVVVDSTGNSDIAAAAGAACVYTDESDIAVQGTGLPPRYLGVSHTNTDFTIADDTDMMDVWHLFVYAKDKYKNAYDLGQLVDTRERRRIVGDFTETLLDQVNKRTYPDTIVQSSSGFDTHGYTIDPYCAFTTPKSMKTDTPYRCLLPKGLDGILVTGLGISAHRDAMPVIRMQPDLQNQGYAAGVAAAMAAKNGGHTRKIDVRRLQRHLVQIGNLQASILKDKDSYPLPAETVRAAVEGLKAGYGPGVAVLLANPEQAQPLLRSAYAAASEEDKAVCAHVLGMMGDATGLETLIAAVNAQPSWDQGWPFKAMGQFGRDMSRLDSVILAMGRTRDRRATPAIVAKVKLLDATQAFSHHRAVALALESLRDPAAAGPLAELLAKPGMTGHAVTSIAAAQQPAVVKSEPSVRRDSLRELILARALYRCGDKDGLGKKILMEYAKDLRGHYARHATAVLRSDLNAKP